MKLSIISSIGLRPETVPRLAQSIFHDIPSGLELEWIQVIDSVHVDRELARRWPVDYQGIRILQDFVPSLPHDTGGHRQKNRGIELVSDGFLCFLDDDNTLHPQYLRRIVELNALHPEQAIMMDQEQGGVQRLTASAANMEPCSVDTGQGTIPKEIVGDSRFTVDNYCGDGEWYSMLYRAHPDRFVFINETLCYYNHLA